MTKLESRVSCTVVVLGDSRTGKSAIIRKFVKGSFKEEYSPTSFDKSFSSQEVEKHKVDFSFWDTSGSPAYDSVRSLSYLDASVFLLCYKISDPISLYNIKNKWIGEIRRHRPDVPVVLCGCQLDLRNDPLTVSHLSRTGRTPVSREQALAICCEIGAVNYVETSAKFNSAEGSLDEAFELCALAAIKHANNTKKTNGGFTRSPSIHSTMSLALFETCQDNHSVKSAGIYQNTNFKRSPSTHSSLSLASNFKMPNLAFKRSSTASVTSLKSPTCSESEIRLMRTFSPEPSAATCRIPPVISENEAYQGGDFVPPPASSLHSFSPTNNRAIYSSRPSSLCEPLDHATPPPSHMLTTSKRLQRPTTLFKLDPNKNPFPSRGALATPTFFSPGPESAQRHFGDTHPRKFDSLSELVSSNSTCPNLIKSPQCEVVWPTNAQVRPNCLSRRTAYRTHPKMAIPVATPMSPVGSEISFDMKFNNRSSCQSPQSMTSDSLNPGGHSSIQELSSISESSSSSSFVPPPPPPSGPSIPVFDLKQPKMYSSLKSSCSQSSDVSSKINSDFSDASSVSYKGSRHAQADSVLMDLMETDLVMQQQQDKLNFVSPKAGVYRPSSGRKAKHGCAVM